MNQETSIFIEAVEAPESNYFVTLESLITIFVYKICDSEEPKLKIKILDSLRDEPAILVNLSNVRFEKTIDIPLIASYCKWPVVVLENSVIAGLCSVARQIIKSSFNVDARKLLGFREACLMACNESSIWTKFCEIDIIRTIKNVLLQPDEYMQGKTFVVPHDLMRFENHMKQPVRTHNVYKIARQKNNKKDIISGTPLDQLQMEHIYAEGVFMTLSDIILFMPLQILSSVMGEEAFSKITLTHNWLRNMLRKNSLPKLNYSTTQKIGCFVDVKIPLDVPNESLYSSDPKRYRPQSRIYTKDADVEAALLQIENLELDVHNDLTVYGSHELFNWSEIPIEANPEGGSLPEKRANRKCEQLESLAKPVMKIVAGKQYRIVDFCSGSGHLGILLAFLLPGCEIILVENKERSLDRAKETIRKIGLTNVKIVQCNLDYFEADFDLGVSLHACGVATDLVIQTCISKKAHFVSCPCCYGGIHDCYHITYPRSKQLSQLSQKEYLNIAHAADQTHKDNAKTGQGFRCMDIIDTDRRLFAESNGYKVHLGKLEPPSCTPKNNILVGIFSDKH